MVRPLRAASTAADKYTFGFTPANSAESSRLYINAAPQVPRSEREP